MAVLISWSVYLADGHLIYTLDDPYIHLAVAESILQDEYGINSGEFSAPSSSIVYPFLLALSERLGFGRLGPLVINIVAMAGSVYVVGQILQRYVLTWKKQDCPYPYTKIFPISLGLAVCLILNAWGLVMTGMEHSLHILSVVLIIFGFLKIINNTFKVPVWLILAIVVMPLIRFEGLAMALLSVIALFYLGRWRTGFLALLLILSTMFGWFQFTQILGLPALPSSVLLKSGVASNLDGQSGLVQLSWSILRNGLTSMNERQGVLLLLGILIISCLCYQLRKKESNQTWVVIGGLAISTGLGHVFFGQYGWFSRYEIYVYALVVISTLVLSRTYLLHVSIRFAVIVALLLIAAPYAFDTLRTPVASRNIYQQQYQMHRFATEYWKRPVAVNDLGWVSYNNPSFVLDLWGLGSEEVRRLKLAGGLDSQALDALVSRRNVSLIMIYDDWFKDKIPTAWRRVAVLNTSRVTAASGQVTFYVTQALNHQEAVALLRQFSSTLPVGTSLNVEP
ncbi:hypothetical protein RF819_11605 [Rhodoferax fermentans]|uniref:Glycosyltransferase RgtA/B/C/D-like domain-containing protein n=1 Tax=Rhodoferax fermentans TaxID=28066 RepID=A0A1T1AYM5_RHOFE|nr:hypothetical protein RF819_11605 [Rhodoferax fermentans]